MANPILDRLNLMAPKQSLNNEGVTAVEPAASTTEALLTEAIQKSQVRTKQATSLLETQARSVQSSTDQIVSAINEQAQAKSISARAELNAELSTQLANQKIRSAAENTQTQVAMQEELALHAKNKDAALDAYEKQRKEEHTGIGIIDGVINAFKNIGNAQDFRLADRREEEAAQSIARVTAAQESFVRVNEITKQSLTEGAVVANLKAIDAESTVAAKQAEIEAVRLNSEAMNRLMTADARAVDALMNKFRVEDQVEARKLSRERMEFARKEMENSMKQWEEQRKARKVALERAELELEDAQLLTGPRRLAAEANYHNAVKSFTDTVALGQQVAEATQRAQAAAGLPVEPRETIEWGLSQGGEVGAKYKKLRDLGSMSSPVLGLTASEASTTLATISPDGNYAQTKYTELLTNIQKDYTSKLTPTNAPKTKEQAAAQLDAHAEIVMGTFAADINTSGNPYHAPPMESLAARMDLSDNLLYTKVLKPAKVNELAGQVVADLATNAVLAGTLKPEEAAAGISDLYKTAAVYNNTIEGGFTRVGLPAQTSYNVTINLGRSGLETAGRVAAVAVNPAFTGMLGGDKSVYGFVTKPNTASFDLTDDTEVQNMIAQILSRKSKATPVNTTNEGTK